MVFRHFGHLAVLFIEKYQYGENRVANSIFKKSFNSLKGHILVKKKSRAFFIRILKFAFWGEKSPELATLM
jgi:hypothetical protein